MLKTAFSSITTRFLVVCILDLLTSKITVTCNRFLFLASWPGRQTERRTYFSAASLWNWMFRHTLAKKWHLSRWNCGRKPAKKLCVLLQSLNGIWGALSKHSRMVYFSICLFILLQGSVTDYIGETNIYIYIYFFFFFYRLNFQELQVIWGGNRWCYRW